MRFLLRLLLLCALVLPARGVIFLATADGAHNREVAPAGAEAAWATQGYFGGFLGTMISPHHFLTAAHVGTASTFVSKSFFNGSGSDVTYAVNPSANGGLGYWNIAGTDLRIFEVSGTFATWARLYEGSDETGRDLIVTGRGLGRGAAVQLDGVDKGWLWASGDGRVRWGTNTVSAALTYGGAQYLAADFNAGAGGDEAHLASGDSGGAVFIQEEGAWKLAGINYAVDGRWDRDGLSNGNGFDAALTDAGGFYNGSDGGGWTLVPDEAADIPSAFYATRVSAYRSQIEAIAIPEAGPEWVALVGLGMMMRRGRGGGSMKYEV